MECLPNRLFDEIRVGDVASTVRTLSERDLELFMILAGGDTAFGHGGEFYATTDMLQQVVAPSLWSSALISWVVGTQLPGPGGLCLEYHLHFHKTMQLGDTIK